MTSMFEHKNNLPLASGFMQINRFKFITDWSVHEYINNVKTILRFNYNTIITAKILNILETGKQLTLRLKITNMDRYPKY